jgi:hypothetical protein
VTSPTTPESAVKNYRILSEPVTLDLYAENPPQWFRIPSWRVEFIDGALKGEDVRVHRGLGSGAPWTLTEATTGALMFREGPRHEYAPDSEMEDVIDEFAATLLPKLTREKVLAAIAEATARLATKIPSPFGTPSETTRMIEDPDGVERDGNGRSAPTDKVDAWKLYCEAFRALWPNAEKVSDAVSPAALQEMVDRLSARSAGEGRKVVAHPEKDADLYLCCADGEGSHEFKVCRGYEGIAAFYEAMTGRDEDGTLDSLKRTFDDPDEWSNDGAALKLELYCARFYIWKVSADELVMPAGTRSASEGRTRCLRCGADWNNGQEPK